MNNRVKKILATLLTFQIIYVPVASAQDVYIPFEKKNNEDSSEIVEFRDLNLKQAILEYYKFHIDKNYRGKDVTKKMLSELTSLNIPWANIFSLDGLEYAVNLKSINLANNFIEDITPLTQITTLEDVNINNNKIKDASSLAKLKKLKKLDIKKNIITNLDFLNELEVEELDISHNTILKERIKEDVNLSNIRTLKITALGLDNLEFLKNANKLEVLYAEENSIKDITPLSELENLKILYVDKNNIEDITALTKLDKLSEFTATQNNITNLEPLKNKLSLHRIILSDNVSLSNIDVLADLVNLSSLSIDNTNISSLDPLKNLKYIYYLSLSGTKISKENQEQFRLHNEQLKKNSNINKQLEIINVSAQKYFSFKNYIFMLITVIILLTGIRSYWKKHK